MAEINSTPSFGGFDVLSNMITGKVSEPEEGGRAKLNEPPLVDPEVIKGMFKKGDEDEEEDSKGDGDSTDDSDEDDSDDGAAGVGDHGDSESDDDEGDSKPTGAGDDSSEPDLSEFESDITTFINSKLSEELGWDISGDDAPKNIQEIIDFMGEIVKQASVPTYASEDIKRLDEFVKDGGNIRDFYSTIVSGRVDPEKVDIENEYDQKRVVREHLGNQGYSEDRINKMIKRYEDAGVLEEEAQDALDLLKDFNKKQEQKLLETQKKEAEQFKEQQQKFISTVEESIKTLDSIRGIKISQKEKDDLLEYILLPDRTGMTGYQRDYMKDIKNLIESAYFTKKGDILLGKAKKQGESEAVKNLHEKLKANKGNKAKGGTSQSGGQDASSGLSSLASLITGNK